MLNPRCPALWNLVFFPQDWSERTLLMVSYDAKGWRRMWRQVVRCRRAQGWLRATRRLRGAVARRLLEGCRAAVVSRYVFVAGRCSTSTLTFLWKDAARCRLVTGMGVSDFGELRRQSSACGFNVFCSKRWIVSESATANLTRLRPSRCYCRVCEAAPSIVTLTKQPFCVRPIVINRFHWITICFATSFVATRFREHKLASSTDDDRKICRRTAGTTGGE